VKSKQKEEQLLNDEHLAAWHCALALEKFCTNGGHLTGESIATLMQASFNAGKAVALYRARCS